MQPSRSFPQCRRRGSNRRNNARGRHGSGWNTPSTSLTPLGLCLLHQLLATKNQATGLGVDIRDVIMHHLQMRIVRATRTEGARSMAQLALSQKKARCGSCCPGQTDVGALEALEAPRSLPRTEKPRPRPCSDPESGSAGPTPRGVAPEGASTAITGAPTTATDVGATPMMREVKLAILLSNAKPKQQQGRQRHCLQNMATASSLAKRQLPWEVMLRGKLLRPISGALLLLSNSSKNRLGRPQCLRLRCPAHKVNKLPVLPVGVRV